MLWAAGCLASALSLNAQSGKYEEWNREIWSPETEAGVGRLEPGDHVTARVEFADRGRPTRKWLRVCGGTVQPTGGRGESAFRRWEYWIDDYLEPVADGYRLLFQGAGEEFGRYAWNRVSGKALAPGKTVLEVPVTTDRLRFSETGRLGMDLEVYLERPGRHPDDIFDAADLTFRMDVPAGSRTDSVIRQEIELPENVACVLVRTGGSGFSGECRMGTPRLSQPGRSAVELPYEKYRPGKTNYWVGMNLVSRNWPEWEVRWNGKALFRGRCFDRASNVADFWVPLPEGLSGSGELEVELVKSEVPASFPYALRKLEIVEESAREIEIIAVPPYAAADGEFGVLVEVNRPGASLEMEAGGSITPAERERMFAETGLHTVSFRTGKAGAKGVLSFKTADRTERFENIRVLERKADGVFLSSGDEIYLDNNRPEYDHFFKWYVRERVGNWYQFRPSYQWSGVRHIDSLWMRRQVSLLEGLRMPFAWQVEGRTLAGWNINPPLEQLESPFFRGKQAHENDGGFYYWGNWPWEGLWSDMTARHRPYGGIFVKTRPIHKEGKVYNFFDPTGAGDMAGGAEMFRNNLRSAKGESTRHTGPSTLFRYFYQVGYDWLGAEQMYGPEEVVMSSLRGASRAYGKREYGTLHAMQWGSRPFTEQAHADRFFLSLAVAYLHGSSHINTEEALWTDEYLNDRYTGSGRAHLAEQHKLLDYIQTHSRQGDLHVNIGVLQGRDDAWKCFGRSSVWGQSGDAWKFGPAGESFDLLKVYYPDARLDAIYGNSKRSDGRYTATPYGCVDLLPVEAPSDVLNRYKVLVFLGWNTYDESDFRRLKEFVERGGTLVLSRAHLNTELRPELPASLPEEDGVLRELLGEGYRNLTDRTERRLGKGRVVYFPQNRYPAEPEIREAYERTLRETAEETLSGETERGWIAKMPCIEFAAWDEADCRTIYLLNIDWWSGASEHGTVLQLNGKEFPVAVRRGRIETVTVRRGVGVMPEANTTSVLDVRPAGRGIRVRVQSTGPDRLRIFDSRTGKTQVCEVAEAGITEIAFR